MGRHHVTYGSEKASGVFQHQLYAWHNGERLWVFVAVDGV